MKVISQVIPEVLLIIPNIFSDNRGFFLETGRSSFLHSINIPQLIQQNHSRSKKGVLRGLHYQIKHSQGKLVRCSNGSIFDVAVDLRRGSPSFGNYVSTVLDDKLHHQLWIPAGFAHGFLVISDTADVCYSCSEYYYPEMELGIIWNDQNLAINWPEIAYSNKLNLSLKDSKNIALNNISENLLPVF